MLSWGEILQFFGESGGELKKVTYLRTKAWTTSICFEGPGNDHKSQMEKIWLYWRGEEGEPTKYFSTRDGGSVTQTQ